MANVAAYRIQDTGPGWKETRFKVHIHIVGQKGQTVAFLETHRETREESLEAVSDACLLFKARKCLDCGEKGFDKPSAQTLTEREALLAMSAMAVERKDRRELAAVPTDDLVAEWAGANMVGAR